MCEVLLGQGAEINATDKVGFGVIEDCVLDWGPSHVVCEFSGRCFNEL
jgi:hypothetical protein